MKEQRSRVWCAIVTCSVFLLVTHLGDLMRLAGLRRFVPGWFYLGLFNLFQVATCLAAIATTRVAKIKPTLAELGLSAPWGRAAVFSLVASLPMLLAFALTSPLNSRMTALSVAFGASSLPSPRKSFFGARLSASFMAGHVGVFGFRRSFPRRLFALGHAYQAGGPAELAEIIAVTGFGSLLGCWLYLRWRGNLWIVFGLHALMNLWWEMFGVADTALGGWIADGARLLTVALAILLTIYRDRFWKPCPGERDLLSDENVPAPGLLFLADEKRDTFSEASLALQPSL